MPLYVSRYISDNATMTEPLRKFIRQDVEWKWSQTVQHAFDKLKQSLTRTTGMANFNSENETRVSLGASPVGIGASFTQKGKVIC